MERVFHVYILVGKSGVLYAGVTGRLAKRVSQHKLKFIPGFTQKYNVTKLVWLEPHASVRAMDRSRKGNQSVAPLEESCPDRIGESHMERFEPRALARRASSFSLAGPSTGNHRTSWLCPIRTPTTSFRAKRAFLRSEWFGGARNPSSRSFRLQVRLAQT